MNRQESFRLTRDALLRRVGRRARSENGGTLVETAFCLTLLLILITGIIEVSWALLSYHYVADAAREGARYAMVRGSDWIATPYLTTNTCDNDVSSGPGYAWSGCTANAGDVENYVASLGLGPTPITASDVCVEFLTAAAVGSAAPTTCTSSSASTVVPAGGSVVEVQITYPFKFGVPGFPEYTYNLKSISEMVIAQ